MQEDTRYAEMRRAQDEEKQRIENEAHKAVSHCCKRMAYEALKWIAHYREHGRPLAATDQERFYEEVETTMDLLESLMSQGADMCHKVLTRQDIAAGVYRLRAQPHKLQDWLDERFSVRPGMHIFVEAQLLLSWVVYDEFLSFIVLDNAGAL